MKVPYSWIKDFVDIDLGLEELAKLLTNLGLEVEGIRLVGLEIPQPITEDKPTSEPLRHEFKIEGLSWPANKFVVAQVEEVLPHPNADRLVLCRLNDGQEEHIVLTGAPNLFDFKGKGLLPKPLKVAYAREGSQLYDGHQPGQVLTTLKRMKIRGVDSDSMICSEKELGISEEHEGVIILDGDAPTGTPLVEYMGDAIFEINILPNMIRNACVLGIAREIAAAIQKPIHNPVLKAGADGPTIKGLVTIKITDPELNPRFVVGMVRNTSPKTSPYRVQLRLKLAGVRPINSIVDTTNYVMLETGEPLHAFDYDVLVKRAGGQVPIIITRAAAPAEKLTTLDGVERTLEDFTILVTDTAGPLSLAGVMGGLESEVTANTSNVLLEGACWNFINIRRTATSQRLPSEASYRFERGIHPALAETGVRLGMERMVAWGGGQVADGLVDANPKPYIDPEVEISPLDVKRLLGIALSPIEITELLTRLEFTCVIENDTVRAKPPSYRIDIGQGVIGKADVLEEIARLYGYDRIPATRLTDEIPVQRGNPSLEIEIRIQDILVNLGLQEVITYRLTSPEKAARLDPTGTECQQPKYVEIQNPIASDRRVMRHSLLESVLEVMEKNSRLSDRQALFEIGPVYIPLEKKELPAEPVWLAIGMSGHRHSIAWNQSQSSLLDFYDLKGIVESFLQQLHIHNYRIEPAENISFHPGKCAHLFIDDKKVGTFGELHPLVKEHYDLTESPVLAAKFDVQIISSAVPAHYEVQAVPSFPPVLEDLAMILAEEIPSQRVEEIMQKAGGDLLQAVCLFDIFRSPQIGEGKKSMAYRLTYLASDRTLTDKEVSRQRSHIIQALENELGAQIRSQ